MVLLITSTQNSHNKLTSTQFSTYQVRGTVHWKISVWTWSDEISSQDTSNKSIRRVNFRLSLKNIKK